MIFFMLYNPQKHLPNIQVSHNLQFVFACYEKAEFDPTENYEERRTVSIYDQRMIVSMDFGFPREPQLNFELSMRNYEAVIFVYHISDKQSFLELPSASKIACNAITPQPVIPQPGRGPLGMKSLVRRVLSRLHLRHTEPQPPPPFMVVAVSDTASQSARPRQVTTEEGEYFSRSIGAMFVEVSCSRSAGVANPEATDEARRELTKRVILKRVYTERLANDGRVVK